MAIIGFCLVAGALAAGYWAGGRRETAFILPDRPRQLVDFTLTERSGRVVRRSDLEGKFCIVSFVFTSCGLTCLTVSRQMTDIQRTIREWHDVRLLSLTVDPRTDTPPVLAKFAEGCEADPEHWLFLTGDKKELYPLIEKSFLPKLATGDQTFPGDFLFTERIALVDPEGGVRAYVDGTKASSVQVLLAELNFLRSHRAPP